MKHIASILVAFLLALTTGAVAAGAPVKRSGAAEPPRGPQVSKRVGGGFPLPLLEVKEGSITVKFLKPDDQGLTQQTLATDAQRTTVLFVESKERVRKPDGKFTTIVKRRRG